MMGECRKVYGWLALLASALFALSSIAGQRVVVSQLPTPMRALAEVETNVVFSTGVATDNKWTLTIERDAVTSNSVEVVFGCDANEDGVLGIEEGGRVGAVLCSSCSLHLCWPACGRVADAGTSAGACRG